MARPIFKRTKLMLTRRVHGRKFLLRPSKRTTNAVGYVLGCIAKKYNVLLHAVMVMSNHWHVCLTDPDGNIVAFQRECHQFIARALNCGHGEFEAVWSSSEASSRVECEGPDDLIERIAYTMANPVEAALVRFGSSWPGLRRAWPSKPRRYTRPPFFFRSEDEGGIWPDEILLEMSRPPGYEELSDDELAGLIEGAIEEREEMFRTQYDREGRTFLGRRAILKQSRHASPTTREPRFRRSRRVACGNKWARIERLQSDKRWHKDYRSAFARWRAGDRDVVFPAGTYKMRILHGVNVADPPT